MNLAQAFDIGNYVHLEAAVASATVPSSSGGAVTNGVTIDRLAYSRRFQSIAVGVQTKLAGSTQQTLSVALNLQHSSDGSSWDNYSTASNTSKVSGSTGATGAQTVNDVAKIRASLVGARRYIRVQVTPTFSLTTSGDSVILSGVAVLGAADELPPSSSN